MTLLTRLRVAAVDAQTRKYMQNNDFPLTSLSIYTIHTLRTAWLDTRPVNAVLLNQYSSRRTS